MKICKSRKDEAANDGLDGIVSSRERERTQDEAHGRDARPFPSSERDVEDNDGDCGGDDDDDGVESGRAGRREREGMIGLEYIRKPVEKWYEALFRCTGYAIG